MEFGAKSERVVGIFGRIDLHRPDGLCFEWNDGEAFGKRRAVLVVLALGECARDLHPLQPRDEFAFEHDRYGHLFVGHRLQYMARFGGRGKDQRAPFGHIGIEDLAHPRLTIGLCGEGHHVVFFDKLCDFCVHLVLFW